MKTLLFLSFSYFFCVSLSGQSDLDKDRYCVTQRKIYDFNSAKKLKNKEALNLLKPYPKAHELYNKSIKQGNIAIASGIAFVGFTAYVAGSEDMKNESLSDYNTTQKIVFAGFVSSASVFVASLFLHQHNRTKSLIEFNKIIEKDSNTYYEAGRKENSIVKLQVDPMRLGLNVAF